MSTLRLPLDRRPIIHDSGFPLGGSRDRRRGGARDDYPADARAALEDHLRGSMGAENYTKACILLNYLISALLGPDAGGESEVGAAMDARRDPRSGELAKMFPASINPRLAPNAGPGERASTAMDSRVHDRTATSLAEMFPDLKAPMKI